MYLKNKDGTPYKLPSPNPIMVIQNYWKDFRLHNLPGKITIFDKEINLVNSLSPKTEPEITKEEIKTEPKIVTPVKKQEEDKNMISVWCSPVVMKEQKDELYGTSFLKSFYGEKFIFSAIMKSQNDFSLILLTDEEKVTENSILYPKTSDKRWWKVEKIIEQESHKELYCSISDFTPKFT